MTDILDAPCRWCGYNGPGYYQAGTHDKTCPWHRVGGQAERKEALDQILPSVLRPRRKIITMTDHDPHLLTSPR